MRINLLVAALLVLAFAFSASGQTANQRSGVEEHFSRAEKLLETGQPQAAARQFLIVLRIDPDNAEAHADLGVIAYFGRDYVGAVHQLSEALRLKPSLSNARALLGLSDERLGHLHAAALEIQQAFPGIRDPKLRLQAGLQLAQIDYQAGNFEKAVPILIALQRLDPTNLDVLYVSYRIFNELANHAVDALAVVAMHSARMKEVVAETLVEEGDLPDAIAAYRAALKIDPQLPGVHLELGEAYILYPASPSFSPDDAEREFKAELAQNPTDAKAESGLGDVYLRRGDLKRSLDHYEHAILLQPGSSEAHLGAGMVLLKMNQLQKAAAELKEATRIKPYNALAHYQLSLADARLGKVGESRTEAAAFQRLDSFNQQLRDLYGEMRKPGRVKAEESLVPQPSHVRK